MALPLDCDLVKYGSMWDERCGQTFSSEEELRVHAHLGGLAISPALVKDIQHLVHGTDTYMYICICICIYVYIYRRELLIGLIHY